jgi:two-component system sensor histidine kinase PilS (NtrC family)
MQTRSRILSASERDTLWRTLQAFNVTRLAIACVLLLLLWLTDQSGSWSFERPLHIRVAALYLVLSLAALALAARVRHRFMWQVASGVTLDLLVIAALYMGAGGARSGLSILFLFPLAGGAILLPLVPALFMASVAALVMLTQSAIELWRYELESSFSQSGMSGAAFFATVLVLHRLAQGLLRQERLTAEHETRLQAQEAINRIVIADTGDGILVLDSHSQLHAANPAAARMLGLASAPKTKLPRLSDVPALAPLADAHRAWQDLSGGNVTLGPPWLVHLKPGGEEGSVTHARLRFVPVPECEEDHQRCVVFLEDVGEIENRAQQLKLASMGRLTASIAHEVRNPLSAITYAISLMAEEDLPPAQRRLAQIVDENAVRLNRLVEDILKLSRKAQQGEHAISLQAVLSAIIADFETTHGVTPGVIDLSDLKGHSVSFDPMHLREVIVNLLANALRYASHTPASIRVFAVAGRQGTELHVEDDGPGITPEVRAHLFEPFYTTSSKGTGLGLYLARELCLNNGAMLDYEYRADSARSERIAVGRFVISFAALKERRLAAVETAA